MRTGCDRCDEHGPYLPSGWFYDPSGARDRHQAVHDIWREVERALTPILDRLTRMLDRRGAHL